MNEKTLNQIASMKNQSIGVEIEMNSITRRDAARVAAEFFGTGRFEDTARTNGYYASTATTHGQHGISRDANGSS